MSAARLPAWVLAGLTLLLVAGCTVEAEDDAHVISPEDVPYGLLVDDRPQPSTTLPDGVDVLVYLVREGELVPVERSLPADADLMDLLGLLAQGADEAERGDGLSSPTPETGAFRGVEVVRGVAEVELGEDFVELAGEEQVLAIGQAVLTLTGRPGVGRVSFTFDGGAVEAPRGDGSVTSDPLARDDFSDLVAPA